MRSSDQGPVLETNWQKHWSETQNLDAGSKQVFEPAGNVVNARDEFVDQYAAHEVSLDILVNTYKSNLVNSGHGITELSSQGGLSIVLPIV